MAAGTGANMVIYDDQFKGGMLERVAQLLAVFNAQSRGSITLADNRVLGNYGKESFWKIPSDPVSRRDVTSTSSVDDNPVSQGEMISVKLNRTFGPLTNTLDSLKKVGSSQEELSFILGQQYADHKIQDQINTAIRAANAALSGQATVNYSANTTATTGEPHTLTHSHLVRGLAKMGDRANSIVAWVMHSKPFFDLHLQAISDKITNVADIVIYGGSPGSLGRPVIVTDSAAIYNDNSGTADTYEVLGLQSGAAMVQDSEEDTVVGDLITGLANLVYRTQGEFAYNVGVKGFKWNTSGGGTNPTDSAVALNTNWTKTVTADKDLAGVRILVE